MKLSKKEYIPHNDLLKESGIDCDLPHLNCWNKVVDSSAEALIGRCLRCYLQSLRVIIPAYIWVPVVLNFSGKAHKSFLYVSARLCTNFQKQYCVFPPIFSPHPLRLLYPPRGRPLCLWVFCWLTRWHCFRFAWSSCRCSWRTVCYWRHRPGLCHWRPCSRFAWCCRNVIGRPCPRFAGGSWSHRHWWSWSWSPLQ